MTLIKQMSAEKEWKINFINVSIAVRNSFKQIEKNFFNLSTCGKRKEKNPLEAFKVEKNYADLKKIKQKNF